MRLNKVLAQSGITSRRKADELIAAGRVRVDGQTVATLGMNIEKDQQVEVDGQAKIQVYGPRHAPVEEADRVWLKIRPEGHSVWPSDWSHVASINEDP